MGGGGSEGGRRTGDGVGVTEPITAVTEGKGAPEKDEAPLSISALSRQKQLQLTFVVMSRMCAIAASSFMGGATESAVLRVMKNDPVAAQRFVAHLKSASAAIEFVVTPVAGVMMDTYGRVPVMVVGQAILAALRIAVAMRPGVWSYAAYRLFEPGAVRFTAPAAECIYSDLLGGSASPLFRQVQDKIEGMMNLARILSYYVGGRLHGDAANFRVGAFFNVMAAVLVMRMRETLTPQQRKQQAKTRPKWQPWAFVHYFNRTRRMRRIALAIAVTAAARSNDDGEGLLLKERFQWNKQQIAEDKLIGSAALMVPQLFSTGAATARRLGPRRAAVFSSRVSALNALTIATARNAAWLNLPRALACCNPEAKKPVVLQAEVARAAEAAPEGTGAGELNAAISSLGLPIKLLMPYLFAEAAVRGPPGSANLLAAFIHVLASEVIRPYAFNAPADDGRSDDGSWDGEVAQPASPPRDLDGTPRQVRVPAP